MAITPPTIVELADVNGRPQVKQDFPVPLRIGDQVALRFKIRRQNGGRTDVLEVDHRFKVSAIGLDQRSGQTRQLVAVEILHGKPPAWHSIKNEAPARRKLGPARFPKTAI